MSVLTIGNQAAVTGSKIAARSGKTFTIKSIEDFYIVATDKTGQEVTLRFQDIIKFRVV